jgi:hypothetical protein
MLVHFPAAPTAETVTTQSGPLTAITATIVFSIDAPPLEQVFMRIARYHAMLRLGAHARIWYHFIWGGIGAPQIPFDHRRERRPP